MHIWDQHINAPELYCLTFCAEPASGLGSPPPLINHGWRTEAIRWDPSNAPTFTFNRRSFPMNFKIGHVERPLNIWKFSVRWGWVFLERTWIVSGIQFTTHFIEFFVMETKQFVHSTVNVISTLQTCAQRSNKAAESKHRALGTISLGKFAIFYKYQNVDETEI